MVAAKLVVSSALVAVGLSACGASVQPRTPAGSSQLVSRGRVDDPRTSQDNYVACLRGLNLQVQEIGGTGIQIGPRSIGPLVLFTPTPGSAQSDQISGQPRYQGAEVIGSALLYPNQGSDQELGGIEACLTKGVKG